MSDIETSDKPIPKDVISCEGTASPHWNNARTHYTEMGKAYIQRPEDEPMLMRLDKIIDLLKKIAGEE